MPEPLCCELPCPVDALLPAVADDASLFVWLTAAGLTGLAVAAGGSAFAASSCWAAIGAVVVQPQPVPDCDCAVFCIVDAALPAVADDPTVFAWDTEPPLPGLSTRIETLVFEGWSWVAADSAPAAWPVSAFWSAVWMPPSLPSQPHDAPL